MFIGSTAPYAAYTVDTAHRALCNAFGEQREIYEWIGLFRGALFFLQGGAFIYSGGHFLGLEKSTAKFRGA